MFGSLVKRDHSFRAASGPVMRRTSGKRGGDDAEGGRDPGRREQVVGGARRHQRVLQLHAGKHRAGTEAHADRDRGDGQQRDGAFQRDDAAQ
jgi:hypothetical protein